jgi:hypothetical protein
MENRGGFRLVFLEISHCHRIEKCLQNPELRPYNGVALPDSIVSVVVTKILFLNKYL